MENGVIHPLLEKFKGGLLARGGASILTLSSDQTSDQSFKIQRSSAHLRRWIQKGETLAFSLQHQFISDPQNEFHPREKIQTQIQETSTAWRNCSEKHQSYRGPWESEVHASGRILQALTYYRTGVILAAPTTSLPEVIGGERNWDYRYTWIRDASLPR
jgi:alpha,alpha-trehalase